ncbi:hypothetical protein GUU_03870 [Malacoplasma iowae 695]|nr:hypothetical protein GUU_03870 [Malacoplasma iowae 695]
MPFFIYALPNKKYLYTINATQKKKKRYYSKKFIKNNLKMGLYENKKWELKKRSLNLNYSVANPLYVVV